MGDFHGERNVWGVNMNEGVRTASHIGLWVAIIIIGIWLVYAATHTNTENNKYGSGTIPVSHTSNNYGLLNLNPCGILFTIGGEKKKAEIKK